MNTSDVYGTFPSDERERLLAQYAAEYHERCEIYDSAVCTARSPRSGRAIPATAREHGLINIHALSVVDDIVKRTGVDRNELWRAITGR